jgi:hypothetical protein
METPASSVQPDEHSSCDAAHNKLAGSRHPDTTLPLFNSEQTGRTSTSLLTVSFVVVRVHRVCQALHGKQRHQVHARWPRNASIGVQLRYKIGARAMQSCSC